MKIPLLYILVRPLLKLWFYFTYYPTYINRESIPKKGRVILAGTHTNNLDGFLLASATIRPVRFIAKKELFKGIGKWFFTSCGMIPVDRSVHDKTVIPAAINLLEKETVIGIFPEGTINRTDEIIMPFKKGAIKMAISTKSPIVPFAIIGDYQKFKKNVKIVFGNLYYPQTIDIEKENKILEDKVKNLIKEGRETK
ncbi:MAG: 1-acyl-sn-glycerol-3-phosphate acyltransferase [Mollicutes bacterium]|nr:1-acyl-sn-glycerol-3-phosphate acyltransferase [Mollicutes bacterium]